MVDLLPSTSHRETLLGMGQGGSLPPSRLVREGASSRSLLRTHPTAAACLFFSILLLNPLLCGVPYLFPNGPVFA